ncbi:MAG: hypothetical protein INH41_20035 [Myxococcaceae bacterium]|nr:hypothetical protein [Myxococcaceae bacterium]
MSTRSLVASAALLLAACPPAPAPTPDAGVIVAFDAGAPVPCAKPESCRDVGLAAVCRDGFCNPDVPCGSDFECSLGERCSRGQCRFTGCTKDADCPTGKCLGDTYSCVECATSADCPADRPVCDVSRNTCASCRTDAECPVPGPGRCGPQGACVHCLVDADCPNGLTCGAGNVCAGVRRGEACPPGTACAPGLGCVNVNNNPTCLPTCSLYQPMCPQGEVCYRLTYANSNSLIFESRGPLGVCFREQAGLRSARELCVRDPATGGSNCQPNLQCVPETASTALCRTYCNPLVSGGCVGAERCVSFPGDSNGRRYGLCLPDTGFGQPCTREGQCRPNLSCQPYDDPSSFDDVSPICQFNVGPAAGLAPCAPRTTDAGVTVSADLACRSGACRQDPLTPGARPYFCFAACQSDADCSIDGRTGVCDEDFAVTTAFGTQGQARGCRPGCESEASCAAYDAGVTCRARLTSSPTEPRFTRTCSPPAGTLRGGAPCVAAVECRSGLCLVDDSRGVRRQGYCVEPCAQGSACPGPGPSGVFASPACLPLSLLASRGFDGQPNTPDDRLLQAPVCAGPACVTSADCAQDGGVGTVCAPMVEPSGPAVTTLRCLPRTTGVKGAGQACSFDAECTSGVCGALQAPSVGAGSVCFEACTGTSACPAGTTCRVAGMRVSTSRGPVQVDSCAP